MEGAETQLHSTIPGINTEFHAPDKRVVWEKKTTMKVIVIADIQFCVHPPILSVITTIPQEMKSEAAALYLHQLEMLLTATT